MHLLDVHTRRLKYFGDTNVPQYAILSHTWGNDEITYQDIHSAEVEARAGYGKVRMTCQLAATHGFEYVWIDTCCIDKSSSTELSEAINSMYRWYQEAAMCYVYLCDVEDGQRRAMLDEPGCLETSRYFTRGWTLQELLAPSIIIFLDNQWCEIGTKTSLHERLQSITRIPSSVLLFNEDLRGFSIAQKMSWASGRQTSRVEDRAYSLLGILDVNMPLLYGEGEKAFIRLQEEIIKTNNDYSIFAWGAPYADFTRGPFASSPDFFYDSHDVVPDDESVELTEPIVSNSMGIHLQARILQDGGLSGDCIAVLPCRLQRSKASVAIVLQHSPKSQNQFKRLNVQAPRLLWRERYQGVPQSRICIQFESRTHKGIRTDLEALSKAASRGSKALVATLLKSGLDPDDSRYTRSNPLAEAITNGHEDVVRLLLSHGAQPESLSLAIGLGHTGITKLMLDQGVRVGKGERVLLATVAGKGCEDLVVILLNNKADPNKRDDSNRLPLHEAVAAGQERIAQLLLTAGATVCDDDIITAASAESESMISLLVKYGANLKAKDRLGRTPLGEAVEYGHKNIIPLLLGVGASRGRPASLPPNVETEDSLHRTFMRDAVEMGQSTVVNALLENGADIDAKDGSGATPLYHAVDRGHGDVVEILLGKGADPNITDNTGRGPLSLAISNGNRHIVGMLLKKGATLPTGILRGHSQLGWAIINSLSTFVELLREHGASSETKDCLGYTPLILSVQCRQIGITRQLLKHGAQVNSPDDQGRTALFWAVCSGCRNMVQTLLKNGAHYDLRDNFGLTPLMVAAQQGYEGLLRLLLVTGAAIDSEDDEGRTALMRAAAFGKTSIVNILLDEGADPMIRDFYGKSALSIAEELGGLADIVQILGGDPPSGYKRKRKRYDDGGNERTKRRKIEEQ